MRMPDGPRKLLLTLHIATSVGWLGAVLAYLALDLRTVLTDDAAALRAAYAGMDVVARTVILPLAIVAFASGVVVSLTTSWGLFRHYWVVLSLVLTALALGVLLVELGTISALAARAGGAATTDAELRALPSTLPHSIGGALVLTVVLALNVVKPKGLTRYGWRQAQRKERA